MIDMLRITVYYENNAMLVSKAVAENLKLHNGYRCKTEKEFWEILSANCTHNILVCKSKLGNNN